MKKTDVIEVNNNRYIEVIQGADEIHIHTTRHNGEIEKVETISGGDFVSMLNWYRYQKSHGNPNLMF